MLEVKWRTPAPLQREAVLHGQAHTPSTEKVPEKFTCSKLLVVFWTLLNFLPNFTGHLGL